MNRHLFVLLLVLVLLPSYTFASAKQKVQKRTIAGESTLRLALMECEYAAPQGKDWNDSSHFSRSQKKKKTKNQAGASSSTKRTLLVERQVRKLDQGVSDVYFIYVQEGQKRLKEFEIPETLMTYDASKGRLKCSLRNQMNASHIEEIDFDLAIEKATFRYQNGQSYDEVNTQGTLEPKCRELRLADSQIRLQRFLEQSQAELNNE